jgi:hypothetical protein
MSIEVMTVEEYSLRCNRCKGYFKESYERKPAVYLRKEELLGSAQRYGWIIASKDKVFCPSCVKEKLDEGD